MTRHPATAVSRSPSWHAPLTGLCGGISVVGTLAVCRQAFDGRRENINDRQHHASNTTYLKIEVVGGSDKSVSDAIDTAIATASRSLRNLEWFEAVDVRGKIVDNRVANDQFTLKSGLRYEP